MFEAGRLLVKEAPKDSAAGRKVMVSSKLGLVFFALLEMHNLNEPRSYADGRCRGCTELRGTVE